MAEFEIRPYRSGDREAVRSICFETGYMGEPIDFLWRDRESFADLFSRYYTDVEPESAFVAEKTGRVVGFLLGCFDSPAVRGHGQREMSGYIRRGALVRPSIAPFLWRSIFDVVRARGAPPEALFDERWPAHLHIDFLPEARGRGLGRRIMNAWFQRLESLGSPGVHLGTFAQNQRAIPFFEACGFARRGDPELVPGFRTRHGARMHVQWMVRSI